MHCVCAFFFKQMKLFLNSTIKLRMQIKKKHFYWLIDGPNTFDFDHRIFGKAGQTNNSNNENVSPILFRCKLPRVTCDSQQVYRTLHNTGCVELQSPPHQSKEGGLCCVHDKSESRCLIFDLSVICECRRKLSFF